MERTQRARRPGYVIFALSAVTFALGSIHAFSIFVPYWESSLGYNRATVSLIYSVALCSLTLAVLLGHLFYRLLAPAALIGAAMIAAATGLWIATSDNLVVIFAGYGLLFGAANGIGYGFALQLSAQTLRSRPGFAMGFVTACYALGAVVTPILLGDIVFTSGNSEALRYLALGLLLVGLLAAAVLFVTKSAFITESIDPVQRDASESFLLKATLWLSYGAAVSAGLMVIGHAWSIAQWLELEQRYFLMAPVAVAIGNLCGGFSAAAATDRLNSKRLIQFLPVGSAVGLILLNLVSPDSAWVALIGFALIGFCYGAIIAVYPVTIAEIFGLSASARVYGQIFTAWGIAGLIAPWLSGWLYDQSGSYVTALWVGCGCAVISTLVLRVVGLPDFYAGRHNR